jgi:hypothetical protein
VKRLRSSDAPTLPFAAGLTSPCDVHEFGMLGSFMPATTSAKELVPSSDVPIPQVAD